MPYIRIWVHIVWATKRRERIIHSNFRQELFDHIRSNARQKDIFLDCLNGVEDHLHALISLGSDQTISKIVQLLKGESSHWINKQKLLKGKFEWQDDYFAVSLSESGIDTVRRYIRNQETHHKKKTFEDEYQEFMEKYGFPILRKDPLG
ncbi:IS200/IS605 family transposase [bacterium]|nr:IS200/IS605 family transposase [bacterium]